MSDKKHVPSTRITADVAQNLSKYMDFRVIRWYIIGYICTVLIVYPLQKLVAPYIISAGIVRWTRTKGTQSLYTACMSLGLVIALAWTMWAILYYINLSMQQRIFVDVRQRIVRDLIIKAKYQQKEHSLGRLVTHLENIPQIFEQVVYKLFNYLIPEATGIVVMTSFFFYVDWRLGVATLGYLLISAIYFISFIGRSQIRAKADYDHQVNYNQRIHNTVDNLSYIQSSQSEPFELHRLATDSKAFLNTKTKFCKQNSIFIAGSNVLLVGYAIVMLCLLYTRMSDTRVSTHQLALSGTVLVVLYAQLSDLDYAKYMLTELYNYTYKSSVFLNEHKISSPDKSSTYNRIRISPNLHLTPQQNQPILVVKNLAYTHAHQRQPVFKGLNLRVMPYTLHAISGPSGCGKTTFGKVVSGIYRTPSSGTLRLFGQDVTNHPIYRQTHIAYVPQNVKLFESSIIDNIRYTCTHLSEKVVDTQLRNFNVAHVLQRHHNDTKYLQRNVGVQGSGLSGGQKQIVLLMRTYFETTEIRRKSGSRTPKSILILDEPTASLDPKMVNVVMSLLKRISQTHTILIITHDARVANHCDKHWSLTSTSA